MRSRPGRDCTVQFPEIQALATRLKAHRVLLDGELVHFGVDGTPDFFGIRRRLIASGHAAARAAAGVTPATFVAFDVLHLNGENLRLRAYEERRARLNELLGDGPAWRVPRCWTSDHAAVRTAVCSHGLEGVVYKRLDGTYSSSQRTGKWLKAKNWRREMVAVTAWSPRAPADRRPHVFYLSRQRADGSVARAGALECVGAEKEGELLVQLAIARSMAARARVRTLDPPIPIEVQCHGGHDWPVREPMLRQVLTT